MKHLFWIILMTVAGILNGFNFLTDLFDHNLHAMSFLSFFLWIACAIYAGVEVAELRIYLKERKNV